LLSLLLIFVFVPQMVKWLLNLRPNVMAILFQTRI